MRNSLSEAVIAPQTQHGQIKAHLLLPSRGMIAAMRRSRTSVVLLGALALVLTLQAISIFTRGMNWDEFWFYGQVHDFLRGSPVQALQTIHVRLFAPLNLLPGDPVDHIRAGRLVMFGCEIFSIAAIIGIARHYSDRLTSLFAALLYVSASYVFQHGYAFRADPLAAALLMGALWLLVKYPPRLPTSFAIAALIAIAGMVTIKSVLLVPAFAGIAFAKLVQCERNERARMILHYCLLTAITFVLFAALYNWHATGLREPAEQSATAMVDEAAGRMFLQGLVPQGRVLLIGAVTAPILSLAVILAPIGIWQGAFERPVRLALAGLWLPVLALFFYRNSFPYFYAFILPPVVIAASIAGLPLVRRWLSDVAIVLALAGLALCMWVMEPSGIQQNQRTIIAAARQIFPNGSAYFDFANMLPSFSKANFFMTSWGYERYREDDSRNFVTAMEQQPVPLLLANHTALDNALQQPGATGYQLKPQDRRALHANYIHHWGPLWVAGHTIPPANGTQSFVERIPGAYTVEGGPITIDGSVYVPGETVILSRGEHQTDNRTSTTATLRWGENLPVPDMPEPDGMIFRGF